MNQKGIAPIIGLIVIVVAAVFIYSYSTGKGSGNIIEEAREVSGFSKIELNGVGNLIINQSGNESLRIEAEDNLIGKIVTEVDNGTLKIRESKNWVNWSFWPTKDVNFYLTVENIESVTINGSGSVTGDNIVADKFDLIISGSADGEVVLDINELNSNINGSGELIMAGSAATQKFTISGSGKYRAGELAGQSAEVIINGSGQAIVNVADQLTVDISGSGDVQYLGSPNINQSISGSGSISQLKSSSSDEESENELETTE
ncbi:MAG: head GIN domain-containing protein [bacterium]